jgi:cytochrome c
MRARLVRSHAVPAGVFAGMAALGLILSAASGRAEDLELGADVFDLECAGCHEIGKDAEHFVGPHLNALFGRRAGHADAYDEYSEGLFRAGVNGLVWDADSIGRYVLNPLIYVSGTNMSYPGLPDEGERNALVAYLATFSGDPADLEEVGAAANRDPEVEAHILEIDGDPAYGEYLSGECVTCHQASGANDGIPGITGWPTRAFVTAMHAYKNGHRPHPAMGMIAGRLADDEIAALAAYFNAVE